MAARFWKGVLGCELLLAAGLAAALAKMLSLSLATSLLTALAVFIFAPGILLGGFFLLARTSMPDRGAATTGVGPLMRVLVVEPAALGSAMLDMIAPAYVPLLAARAPDDASRARPVLLIHGIVCNHAIWRPWLKRLAAAGFGPVRALDLEPLFADIDRYAVTVEQELLAMQRQCDGARVAIVAHSMGGLVARAALRSLGPSVIRQIITIGSPHHGTTAACRLPWRLTQQMCPDSPWLRTLNKAQEGQLSVPFACIYSLEDNLVLPASSAALAGAQLFELRGLGHVGLLRSRQTINCALSALA